MAVIITHINIKDRIINFLCFIISHLQILHRPSYFIIVFGLLQFVSPK